MVDEAVGDVFDDFSRRQTPDEKIESFEQSTLSLVLRQLGVAAAKVKSLKNKLREGYTFDWFNEQQVINPVVDSTRIFRFSFLDLFFQPRKSELLSFWYDDPRVTDGDFILIFRVYDHGRVVFTNFLPNTEAFLAVAHPGGLLPTTYVTPFPGFFNGHLPSPPDLGG